MKHILFLISFFISTSSTAQQAYWTWVNGKNASFANGTYGTKGVPDTANCPGSRYRSMCWTDKSGNFWLYGGVNMSSAGGNGTYNDMWKYNPTTGEWTWVFGNTQNQLPAHNGVKGVYDSTNTPGSRNEAAAWVDTAGNFWMYGGFFFHPTSGYRLATDLWKFNVDSSQWIWMSGTDSAGLNSLGALNVPGVNNHPPSSRYLYATWTDDDHLYLYGGLTGISSFSELWRYTISTNEWTKLTGYSFYPVRGTMGIEDVANNPGKRAPGIAWKDAQGYFWMYGGINETVDYTAFTDVWRYNPVDNQWAWMSGPDSLGAPGLNNPTLCTQTGISGLRFENNMWWLNQAGHPCYFGGGWDTDASYDYIWELDPPSAEMIALSGHNVWGLAASFGTPGVTDNIHYPGSRMGCAYWVKDESVWFFSGVNYSNSFGSHYSYNDMWRLSKDSLCNSTVFTGELVKDDFKLYPNPATNELNIRPVFIGDENINYHIYDMQGKLLLSGILQNNSVNKISLKFSSGMYLICLKDKSSSITKKFSLN